MARKEPAATTAIPKQVEVRPAPVSTEGVRSLGEALRVVNIDPFLRLNMWPQWLEQGYQICDHCGYVINPTSGLCVGNPEHVAAPYNTIARTRTILLG